MSAANASSVALRSRNLVRGLSGSFPAARSFSTSAIVDRGRIVRPASRSSKSAASTHRTGSSVVVRGKRLVGLGDERAFVGVGLETRVSLRHAEEPHSCREVARESDVWVLVGSDRNHRGFRPVELGVEDVRHLGDDGLHVRDVGLAAEAVDALEFGEVGLHTEFEREVLQRAVVDWR